MWSSRPLTDCWLEESGVWTDIPDSHVEVVLANDVTSLISYSVVVEASKPQMPGSSFLGEYLHNGGSKDFLQVQVHKSYLVPGIIRSPPRTTTQYAQYEYSSTYSSTII